MSKKQGDRLRSECSLSASSLIVPLGHSLASLTASFYPYDSAPQVCAPPLTWMCTTHAYSQGHLRLNSDIVSYNMSGVDVDGEGETRGPWDWACGRALKGEARQMVI